MPKRKPDPHPPLRLYYLGTRPGPAPEGYTPMVLVPRHNRWLYEPDLTEAEVKAWATETGTRLGPGWWAAFWSENELSVSPLYPWDDDEGWETLRRNAGWLAAEMQIHGGAAVAIDVEHYSLAVNQSGPMLPGAWPGPAQAARRRGEDLGQVLHEADLLAGGFCWPAELTRRRRGKLMHPGLRGFLSGLWREAEGVFLGEDYSGEDEAARRWVTKQGARYVEGFWPRGAGWDMGRESGWVYDPGGILG